MLHLQNSLFKIQDFKLPPTAVLRMNPDTRAKL